MKIIDVIKNSAELLGLSDAVSLIETSSDESVLLSNEDINRLFNLSKFSIQELCSNYVPVETENEISTTEKTFPMSELANVIRVLEVRKNNNIVKHKIINRNLVFEEDGNYIVKYTFYPNVNSIFDEIDFLKNFSPDVIVFGLCAYFSLAKGMFEEFESFHDNYIERAESLKTLRVFSLPQRSWR